MSLNQEAFDALVSRLEQLAKQRPGAYKLRVLLFALLGYAYIFAIVAVLLGLIVAIAVGVIAGEFRVNFFFFKIIAVLLVLTGVILRALWVKIEPPEGVAPPAEKVGRLVEAIDGLRTELQAPRVHQVLLTDEFNASVAQVPRLGAFGWYKNYLSVGLPLLHALSPDQFRAVIAHEFGHLSGAHGRFSGWIYRIRTTWIQLLARLEEREHWGSFIFVKFFEWYAPYFAAYSFVLARAQEYEADRLAAEKTGEGNVGDALVRIEVGGAFLQEEFWPAVYNKAAAEADPPPSVYSDMRQALGEGPAPPFAEEALKHAVAAQTSSDDTHPALSDRLAALGLEARLPAPIQMNAAEYFLAGYLEEITDRLGRDWEEQIKTRWRERHAYAVKSQHSLRELEEKAKSGPLPLKEAWDRAYWTEEFHSREAALPLYREVLSLQPEHADALFSVGRILLSRDDRDGIIAVRKAMQLDGEYTLAGCQLVCGFLLQNGEEERAKEFFERAVKRAPAGPTEGGV